MCANHDVPGVSSPSRRGFLFKLGLALNVIGAALVGIPVLGYILAPARRLGGGTTWIKLDGVAKFPEGQTRLAIYENPFRVPWDGASAKVACWVRRLQGDSFQIFAVNCAHLGCPVRWFAQSKLFMATPVPTSPAPSPTRGRGSGSGGRRSRRARGEWRR